LNNITRSDAAFVSVITGDWSVLDSILGVAGVSGASVVITELSSSHRSVLASRNFIARVDSARVFIVTVNRSVNTFCLILRASVNGANVVIVTILSTIVCEDTSCLRIARFVSARILVITNNNIMVNSSSCSITPVGCASVVVVNVDRSVNAVSTGLIATVSGARIVIITRNRCSNNS
jgi:hypothetical protein